MDESRQFHFPKKLIPLFAVAAALLVFSSIGGARASLQYMTEGQEAQVVMETSSIGLTLNENDQAVANRDYEGDGEWDTSKAKASLLADMLADGEELKLGKAYPETLTLTNSGKIDTYVRVVLYRYWTDKDGYKLTNLDPSLIDLDLAGGDWILDESASTDERLVLYYKKILEPDQTTATLLNSVTVDSFVASKVKTETKEGDNGYKTITTTYDYDGASFNLEVEADAVQTHNAEDAILSAWGRAVNISDSGTLSLK